MQAQDAFSVPRRSLDIEDYVDIARRHRAWIIGPLFAGLVTSVVAAFLWPNTYLSRATVKVVPQQVPESYVQSNVNQLMSDRISSMAQTVLSRAVLSTIIQSLDLYPRDRARLPMEDVVEKMKSDLSISNVVSYGAQQPGSNPKSVPAFQIAFSYTDRFKAQKVVSELSTKFIDQSIRERAVGSEGTNRLLKDQWDAAKKEMEDLDTKLAEFRSRNQGRLPDEMQSNLQAMNALQVQLTNLNAALSRVAQEKLMLENNIRLLREQLANLKEPAAVEQTLAKSDRVIEAEREVALIEKQLSALREHYLDTYPGVQTHVGLLAQARKRLEAAQKDDAARKPEARQPNSLIARELRDLDANIKRNQSLLEAKEIEAESFRRDLARVNASMGNYQARLEGTPFSEKEYTELVRDRDLAKSKFLDLDQKMTKSNIADEMEKRKFGESLDVLDPASLPQTPTKPQREVWIGIGAVVGLAVGMLLAGAREMKDTSLKNLKDVRAYTQLQILGSIPLLENDLVVKRRKRLAWLGWSVAVLAGVVMMTGSVIYYFVTKA
jgi:polysaccharide chain length determinant protein (PEP-CTERM system associated)